MTRKTFISRIMLLLMVLAGAVTQVWAADEAHVTITFGSGVSISNSALSGIANDNGNITMTTAQGDAQNAPAISSSQLRLYAQKTNGNGGSVTITSANKKMAKVVFTFVSGYAGPSGCVSPDTYSVNSTTGTWTGSANSITMQNKNTSTSQIRISKIEIYYEITEKTDPTVSFSDGNVRVGKTLDLSALFSSNNSGAVTYSITSGDNYATLSGSTLTGTAVGSVTVKASQAAAGAYNAAEASATITVNAALTLSSIAITTPPTTTEYTEGDYFDETGMVVTATYSDASTDDVTSSCTFEPSAALTTSDTEITVSYTENGVTKTATQAIAVEEKADYARLPFSWEGGTASALQAVTGVTASGLGGDYAESNKPYRVKFDTTGDYIQIKTNERPGTVTVGVKMLGGSTTSYITVQGSSDGTNFTDVEKFEISGSQNTVLTLTTTKDFAATDRYVRLTFTKGANVGVGPISIAKYVVKYTFNFSVNPAEAGSVVVKQSEQTVATGDTFAADTQLTLAATANEGYSFSGWTEDNNKGTFADAANASTTFTMPADAASVKANFTANTYALTVNSTHGNVAVTVNGNTWDGTSEIAYGATVSLTATAATDWAFSEWTATGVTLADATANPVEFAMPAAAVTLAANYIDATVEYTITLNQNAGGTIEASAAKAVAGTEITLTATPASGYVFASWTVLDGDAEDVAVTDNKFNMPGSDVEVEATFTRVYTAEFYVNGSKDSEALYAEDATIVFPEVSAVSGQTFVGWTTSEIDGIQATAPTILVTADKMGTADITYHAVFATVYGAQETATLTASHTKNSTEYASHTYTDDKGYTWSAQNTEPYESNVARYGLTNTGTPARQFTSPTYPGNITAIVVKGFNGSGSDRKFLINSEEGKSGDLGTIAVAGNTKLTAEQTADLTNTTFKNFVLQASGALGFSYIKVTYDKPRYSDYCTTIPTTVAVTVTAAKYATFSNARATDFSKTGITVYTAKVEGNVAKMTAVADGIVPANTGVVLFSETTVAKDVPFTTTDATLSGNDLVATVARTLVAKAGGAGYNYILQSDGADGIVFNMATPDGAYMPAGRAYLSTSYDASPAGARLLVSFNGYTTGISASGRTASTGGNAYNLQGQRVSKAQKGLYIVNGKKVVIK